MTSSPILPEPLPVAAISENQYVQGVIDFLDLQRHTVGGYLVETDRDPKFPKSFQNQKLASNINNTVNTLSGSETRDVSTKIFCYLTSGSPFGAFHRNKSRTIHTLHWGRGRYVTIHADEVAGTGQKARVETFVVGKNLLAGEKTQWIVEEGIYKSSFLLPDEATGLDGENNGLLISETVIPGVEYADHDFLSEDRLRDLVTQAQADELSRLLKQALPLPIGEPEGRKPRHWEKFGMMI